MADAAKKESIVKKALGKVSGAFFGTAKKAIDYNLKGVDELTRRLSITQHLRKMFRTFAEPRGPSKPPPIKWF